MSSVNFTADFKWYNTTQCATPVLSIERWDYPLKKWPLGLMTVLAVLLALSGCQGDGNKPSTTATTAHAAKPSAQPPAKPPNGPVIVDSALVTPYKSGGDNLAVKWHTTDSSLAAKLCIVSSDAVKDGPWVLGAKTGGGKCSISAALGTRPDPFLVQVGYAKNTAGENSTMVTLSCRQKGACTTKD